MEQAVAEDHLHPRLGDAGRQGASLLGRHHLEVGVREGGPVQPVLGQHATGALAPVDSGHPHVLVALEVAAHGLVVTGLVAVIQLLAHRARELVHQPLEVDERQALHPVLRQAGQPVEQVDVGIEGVRGTGPLHLHHHLLAAGKPGHVHLAHRRAADGHRVERLEGLLEREAEFLLHHLADGVERLGAGLVLQLAQLGDDVVGNNVGAR